MSTKRTIETNLIKKGELFNIIALAEAMELPILLIGEPGVAKTAAILDYAKSKNNGSIHEDSVFLLETDEGTKSNAVKGNIDLEELTINKKYKTVSPIVKADFVIINEIDKASASLRNSLLSVMNEKMLFNGQEKVKCKWKTFIATCNKIPEDEKGSPFWDRFIITYHVERLRKTDIIDYYKAGGKRFKTTYSVNLPEDNEVNTQKVSLSKLDKVMDIGYETLSDRTLSFLPSLVKNIMIVFNLNQDRALIKATELLIGKNEATILAKNIMPEEIRQIYDKIDMISSCENETAYRKIMNEINKMGEALSSTGKLTPDMIEDITNLASEEQDKLEFLSSEYEEEIYEKTLG